MIDVPKTTAAIDADWLTSALQQRGLLKGRVSDVRLEPIGAGVGLMAELGRLQVTYQDDEGLPATMIAKCSSQNENINVARVLDFYNREVNFYNRIGKDSLLNVPDSYFGQVDQESYDHILLMEDLGDVSPRDQITGASADEAERAIGQIALMHAKYWDKVASEDWMYPMMSVAEAEKLKTVVYQPAVEPAIEKFPDFFNTETAELCRQVGQNYQSYWVDQLKSADTFIHGDYRQDNLLYGEDGLNAKVMDWQISGSGKGIFDVTYFMCQSLPPATRKAIEKEILTMYTARLAENGVKNYPFAAAWEDYRVLMLGCLVYPITVCGTLDTANERGRALGECMIERNLVAIEELGCAALL